MTTIIDRKAIVEIINDTSAEELLSCIKESFISYSNGTAVVPPVGTLSFQSPPADLHIKYGYVKGASNFVIKIASGFYNNPALGLSSSNGLNLVFNQENGLLETILLDEGYLTDIRTALAGAVVAKYFAPAPIHKIGIIGTGIQARLQLKYLSTVTDCKSVMVWGRSQEKARVFKVEMSKMGFDIEIVADADSIAEYCNLIVTTTPSTEALVSALNMKPGTLITAMGSDTIGKQELNHDILARANLILMDSESQCKHHGEIHKLYETGELDESKCVEIGTLLAQDKRPDPAAIVVADLTGIATQDILISKLVLDQIKKKAND